MIKETKLLVNSKVDITKLEKFIDSLQSNGIEVDNKNLTIRYDPENENQCKLIDKLFQNTLLGSNNGNNL